MASIEATLARLANCPAYQEAVSNLLGAQTWDEYQEHRWMLKVTFHLAQRSLLRETEVNLPNGTKPDIRAEADLEGPVSRFNALTLSWSLRPARTVTVG